MMINNKILWTNTKIHGNGMARSSKSPKVQKRIFKRKNAPNPFETNNLEDVINREVKKIEGGVK